MSDRLAELQRQRALVQEHLAWLEREIAATGKASDSPPPAASFTHPSFPPTPAIPVSPVAPARPAPPEAHVDELLAQYRSAPGAVRKDVRKGCLLYFGLALVALAAGVAVLYFALGPQ